MSVVIKGVNAPNNCYDCINSNDGEPFELLSNCHTFGDLCEGKITANELPKDKRNDSCPVKQLPTPHGRLIDADELYNKFKNEYCNRNCDSSIQGKRCDHCGVPRALNIILNAPTIIEAEESE